jgi:hypothetical protein
MGWVGYVARLRERIDMQHFSGEPEGKRALGRPRRKEAYKIKTDFQGIGRGRELD